MANFSIFSDWFYRGEGNKTLVISNPQTRKVLRLQKSNVTSNSAQDTSRKGSELLRVEFEKCIKLCKQVFIPLLSEKYVEPGTIVELPEEFMTKIKDLVTSANTERPNFRLSKEVNGQSKFGILMPDFCFVSGDRVYVNEVEGRAAPPTFCVEIKPKCGTMPACAGLEDDVHRDVKESMCKYCLLQWTKVNKEGKYLQRSGYCPLDLFSSDIRRVWHALICLLKNPQNNFRIFQDGKMVHSDETTVPSYGQQDNGNTTDETPSNTCTSEHHPHLLQLEEVLRYLFTGNSPDRLTNHNLHVEIDGTNLPSITMFLATLIQLLIHDSNASVLGCHRHGNHHSSKHPVCAASRYNEGKYSTDIPTFLLSNGMAFNQGGVLRKILDVQKLDKIGTDEAFSIFNELCASGCKDVIDSHIFMLNESVSAQTNANCNSAQTNANCDNAHTNVNCDNNITDGCITNDYSLIFVNDDDSEMSELDSLTKLLIAASANDCSIMISFQEVIATPMSSSYFQDILTGKVYRYSIAIVDLDQKDSDRIPKYHKEYHDIIDNYLRFKDNE